MAARKHVAITDDLPLDIIQAWRTAGANYGVMRIEWEANPARSYVDSEPPDGSKGLPAFSFSRWRPGLLATLPIPESPFGLSFRGCDGCNISTGGLKELSRFSSTLLELELWGANIAENDIQDLHPLDNLRTLGICSTGIWTSPAIRHLANLTALETLRLSQSKLTVVEARLLSGLPCLKDLYLHVGTATVAGLECLAALSQLRAIRLKVGELTSEAADRLAGLHALQFLEFGNSILSDGSLASLAALPQLETLRIYNTDLTDADMKALALSESLVHLDIAGTKVTDAGLIPLAKVKTLRGKRSRGQRPGFQGVFESTMAFGGPKRPLRPAKSLVFKQFTP